MALMLPLLLNPSLVVSVCVFLASLLIFFVIRITRSLSVGGNNFAPSPPRLPLIGNLHQLGTHPHRSLRALSNEYGALMLMHLGRVPTLIISSADLVKEVIQNHDIVFSDRPDMTACEILFYGRKDVAFSSYGEYWRQARKICILELLSLKRVQQFHFVREEEVTLCMNKIRNAARSGEPVNLSELLLATPNNIISRCILGQRVEDESGRSWFGELSRQIMIDLMAFSMGDFYPSLRWVDVLRGFVGRLNSNFRALDTFLDQVIEERRAATKSDVDGTENVKADFVDILLRVQREEKKLTQDHMKAILLDMFVGGTDTTSASSEWLMTELLRNPRVMKKAQEEVRKVVGNKKKIEMSDINKMDYLKCVIKETFRLHPSAPLLLPRETSTSVKVGGRQIPAKTRVFINAWAIQRDPNVWERPEEFIPERFENKTVDFNFDLLVFGCGRRKCPGLTFGMVNIEYIAANILFWFDWKLSGKPEDLDMSEVYGLSVTKKNALHVVPIPYSP